MVIIIGCLNIYAHAVSAYTDHKIFRVRSFFCIHETDTAWDSNSQPQLLNKMGWIK